MYTFNLCIYYYILTYVYSTYVLLLLYVYICRESKTWIEGHRASKNNNFPTSFSRGLLQGHFSHKRIVGTPPLIKGVGEGIGPSKKWITWGGDQNFLLEREDKPEKGEVDVEMVGLSLLLLIQF